MRSLIFVMVALVAVAAICVYALQGNAFNGFSAW